MGCAENYCGVIILKRKITILSHGKAAIKALDSNTRIMNQYGICIMWLSGNCRANGLAKRGTTIELSDEFLTLEIPLDSIKLIIDKTIMYLVSSRLAA